MLWGILVARSEESGDLPRGFCQSHTFRNFIVLLIAPDDLTGNFRRELKGVYFCHVVSLLVRPNPAE
jgi:hypothetical protein